MGKLGSRSSQSCLAIGIPNPSSPLEFPIQPHHGAGIPNPARPRVWNSQSNLDTSTQEENPKEMQDEGRECREFPPGGALGWLGMSFPWILSQPGGNSQLRTLTRPRLLPSTSDLCRSFMELCAEKGKEKIPLISQEFQGKAPNPSCCSGGPGSAPSREFLVDPTPFPPPLFGEFHMAAKVLLEDGGIPEKSWIYGFKKWDYGRLGRNSSLGKVGRG